MSGHPDWKVSYRDVVGFPYRLNRGKKLRKIFVYRIHGRCSVKKPTRRKVADAYRTGEVWRLKPTKLKYLGELVLINETLVLKRKNT